jgi:pyridinium-3,5-bisthiocarboxylic acid mononucleotide nickel chelatase
MMDNYALMKIAYLECFSGISGDMFLGALVDAGVPPELFIRTVKALGVDAQLEISRVNRSGISATKLDVIAAGEKELPREEFWESQKGHSQEHSHAHGHEHGHSHSDGATHTHKHQHPHRGLKEIRQIIGRADIPDPVKTQAIRTFEALGAAEAKVHNSSIEDIHFHEVGAIDAIVDIVCAAAGAQELGANEWICSPLNVGGGTVNCAHGIFPVPAPATLDLLKNAPVYSGEIQKELVTPTGAAIVSTLATRFGSFPAMKIEKSGYGAGTRDFHGVPNVLRLTIGKAEAEISLAPVEEINILEANLDDMNPQVFGYVMDRALELGALDVFGTAVQMKKNRPGMLLTVLCRPEGSHLLTRMLFAETTTLGVRMRRESRSTLARRHVSVSTRWGEIRMKLANLNGTISNYAPEYEDCRRIAEHERVPLKTVMQEAIKIYLEDKNG